MKPYLYVFLFSFLLLLVVGQMEAARRSQELWKKVTAENGIPDAIKDLVVSGEEEKDGAVQHGIGELGIERGLEGYINREFDTTPVAIIYHQSQAAAAAHRHVHHSGDVPSS